MKEMLKSNPAMAAAFAAYEQTPGEIWEKLPQAIHAHNRATASLVPFNEVWRKMEARGYRYGADALEQVRFGYSLASAIVQQAQTPNEPMPEELPAVPLSLSDLQALVDYAENGGGQTTSDLYRAARNITMFLKRESVRRDPRYGRVGHHPARDPSTGNPPIPLNPQPL
jgi:hypothetical protein